MIPSALPVLTPAQYGAVAPSDQTWPVNRGDRISLYNVTEIYPTVQGEGRLAGTPMTIIRLQGCPVACIWCFGIKQGKHVPQVHAAHPRGGRTARIPLHHVAPGDVLLTFDTDQRIVETTVTHVHTRDVSEWYDVKIDDRLYYVTAEHPFATTRGWVQTKDLRSGDTIYHMTPNELLSFYKWGERNPNYSPETYMPNVRALKRRNQRGRFFCDWCKIHTRVEVHHIDENTQNDSPQNLVSVCHSCHSKYHRRGFNFWNGARTDGKRNTVAELQHNGAVVNNVRLVKRGTSWARRAGGGYIGTLPVYNLTCAPHNSFLLDYMWVHNCDQPETWMPDVGAWHSAAAIAWHAAALPPRWALVTGGEPAWHALGSLTQALRYAGLRCALETSGVYPISGVWNWICLSPKPDGRMPLMPQNIRLVNEIKWLVGRERDVEAFERFLAQPLPGRPKKDLAVSIQPISCSPKATRICLDALMKHPTWFLSAQLHKYLGVA